MELIALNELALLDEKEQIKAKINIIDSHLLEEIPSGYLPPVHSVDYYFVSYSHKDYRLVYRDIFLLQDQGVNIWYDRGIPAGKDWQEVANRYIAPFSCKGVLFYLSEAALLSDAIEDEMDYSSKMGKPFIPIMLPISSDFTHNGEKVKGKIFPLAEMIDILEENGRHLSKKRKKILAKMFPSSLIYLKYDTPAMTKAEKIQSSLPEIPVLRLGEPQWPEEANILGVLDPSIERVDVAEVEKALGREPDTINVGPSAFANCRYLRYFDAPLFHVDAYAFYRCSSLERVDIGPNVEEAAFLDCTNLTKVDIASLRHIPKDCFAGCASLTSAHIEATKVESGAFARCAKLKVVFIGKDTYEIADDAFEGCVNLTTIRLDPDNQSFQLVEGILVDKNGDIVCAPEGLKQLRFLPPIHTIPSYLCARRKNLEEVEFGESVTQIEAYSFMECDGLDTVVIPGNVEVLGQNAFEGCKKLRLLVLDANDVHNEAFKDCPKLRKVGLGPNVEALANNAFSGCELTQIITDEGNKNYRAKDGVLYDFFDKENPQVSVSIQAIGPVLEVPEGVKNIGPRAFAGRPNLKKVILTSSVTVIEPSAFAECHHLEEAVLNEGLQVIEHDAFDDTALHELILPSTVVDIEGYRFGYLPELKRVEVAEGSEHFASKDGALYSADYSELILVPRRKSGTFVVPKSVTIIERYAFAGCTKLRKIVLPEKVFDIRDGAFSHCHSLSNIDLPSNLSFLGEFALANTSIKKVTLPSEVLDASPKAFTNAKNLEVIEVGQGSTSLSSKDGLLYDAEGKTLIRCPEGRAGIVLLPDGLETIATCAFQGCEHVTRIIVPPSVKCIEKFAFFGVDPTLVFSIGKKAFAELTENHWDAEFHGKVVFNRK